MWPLRNCHRKSFGVLSYELVCRIRVVLVHRASTSILVSGCQRCLCPRGEPTEGPHLVQRHENNGDQAARPISTGQLHALQRFHPRPINVVVYDGPLGGLRLGIPDLEVSFPLRCFQRLSIPDIATRRCHWHDNRITSGPSTRVLSYYGQGLARILRPRQIGTELSHDVLNPARVPL